MRRYRKEELLRLRLLLVLVWAILLTTVWLFSGCTELPGTSIDRNGGKQDDTTYPVTFSRLSLDEGEQTRATQVVESGRLRLVVYRAGVEPTGEPVANRVYTVAEGLLTVGDDGSELELLAGSYRFYALMPSDRMAPSAGEITNFKHGDDPLSSLTEVMVDESGAYVTLEPLTHKASRVEFVVSKADDATYRALSLPSCLTLYSQTEAPVSFRLGKGGGSLDIPVAGGLDTLCFKSFAGTEDIGFRQDRLVLPRTMSDFNLLLETMIDTGDGNGPQACTVKGRVENRLFEPGRYYHFSIRVKDLREGGDIMLMVTDWNSLGWEDNMGGNGVSIVAGKWTGIVWNDDMGS